FHTGVNLVQPIDTSKLTRQIKKLTLLHEAALTVLQYSNYCNPEQATEILRRLPFLMRHEESRVLKGQTLDPKLPPMFHGLLHVMGDRFVQVFSDCNLRQIERGAWALAAARHQHDGVALALSEKLKQLTQELLDLNAKPFNTRVTKPTPEQLNSGIFASRVLVPESVNQLPVKAVLPEFNALAGIAWALATVAGEHSAAAAKAALEQLAEKFGALQVDPKPLPDADSLCRLAWAFAKAGVHNPAAVDKLFHLAEERLKSQLQAHDPASGPLRPRCTYRYKTVRGWVDQHFPRKPRDSSYLGDTAPKIIPRDFEIDSLGSLLSAAALLRDQVPVERLQTILNLAAQHTAASSVAGGALQPLMVTYEEVTRVLAACEQLGFRSSTLVTPLLHGLPMAALSAEALSQLAAAATLHHVRSRTVYLRIVRAFNAKLSVSPTLVAGAGIGAEGKKEGEAAAALGAQLLLAVTKAGLPANASVSRIASLV
uniref:mL124 n=1 Tax=Polytomella magna TaxID=353565 RepID=UPI002240E45A|nr:Chain Xe, mL124 [Polytomella magna]8APN_Xe Chain Xe, mL124 [Polytomella magna]8APO_Xe Chain Xe, mL124 [Polytomella magna]